MSKKIINIDKRKDEQCKMNYFRNFSADQTDYDYVEEETNGSVTKSKVQDLELTFGCAAKLWLESQKSQLKQSSVVKYTNLLYNYLYPCYERIPIASITREDVINYSNRLLQQGGKQEKGLSPKTVSCIISVMKSVLEHAARYEKQVRTEIDGIYIKQTHKTMRIFSITEQKKLSNSLCDNPSYCNLGILICLYTGIRIGELCALKWGDFSLEEHSVYIHKTMQRIQNFNDNKEKTSVIITEPKSACSIRTIPLPDDLYHILQKYQKSDAAFLLTGSCETFIEPRTMQNQFKKMIRACRIADANFHTLRHTFATRCVELGFDIKSLSEILGHASVNITLNRYVHPSMELKQKNMNRLSSLFSAT